MRSASRKSGAFACVAGDDVLDDDGLLRRRVAAHGHKFCRSAKGRIDGLADAVEVAVDGGGEFRALQASRQFHRPRVDAPDADLCKGGPECGIAQGGQHRLALLW